MTKYPDLGSFHDPDDIMDAFQEFSPAADRQDLDFHVSDSGKIFLDWDDHCIPRRFRVMQEGLDYDFEEV